MFEERLKGEERANCLEDWGLDALGSKQCKGPEAPRP